MMFKIQYHLIFIILLISSCSSFKWQPAKGRPGTLPYTFDQTNILGNGLKITDQGYQTLPCLKSFKTTTSKGLLDLRFFIIDEKYHHQDSLLDQFIQDSLNNVQRFNLSGKKPFSFILVITIKDRLTAIQEETIEFREDIHKLISDHNKEKFYDSCGTDFIDTITFNNEVYFFFSYYPGSATEKVQLEEKIKINMDQQENNIHKINIFKDFSFTSDSYFSLQATTDRFLKPMEFPFQKYHGKNIDVFLNDLLTTVVNSSFGQINNYSTSPWLNLNTTRNITPLNGRFVVKGYSDETIYKSLLLLENSIGQFNIWQQKVSIYLKQNKGKQFAPCRDNIIKNISIINWQKYRTCRQEIIAKQSINLNQFEACRELTSAIADLNKSQICLFADKEIPPIPIKVNIKNYEPGQLKDHIEKNPVSSLESYITYRFNDEAQFEKIPRSIPLGTGADLGGKLYKESCILEKSKQYSGASTNRIHSVSNDYFPYSTESWPWWKKMFLFWKDSPQWTRFRGSYEIKGLSNTLTPDFKLIPEVEKLPGEDLAAFFRRCGTHYISQIEHRRGFAYYFEPKASEEKPVEITTYGLAPPDLLDMTSIPSKPVKKVDEKNEKKDKEEKKEECEVCFDAPENGEPVTFELPNPKVFFHQKNTIINLFKNDSAAIPSRLSLIPWTEYLLNLGVIEQSQLNFQ